MSDEHRKDEELDVDGHVRRGGVQDEPSEDVEEEFEAHVHRASSARMDSPSNT
jgi:hypothetical protein